MPGGEACEASMDVIISSLIAKNTTKLCIPGVTSQTLAVMDLESLVGPEDGLDMGTDKKSSSDFAFRLSPEEYVASWVA